MDFARMLPCWHARLCRAWRFGLQPSAWGRALGAGRGLLWSNVYVFSLGWLGLCESFACSFAAEHAQCICLPRLITTALHQGCTSILQPFSHLRLLGFFICGTLGWFGGRGVVWLLLVHVFIYYYFLFFVLSSFCISWNLAWPRKIATFPMLLYCRYSFACRAVPAASEGM